MQTGKSAARLVAALVTTVAVVSLSSVAWSLTSDVTATHATRLLDTRTQDIAAAGTTVQLQITGRADVPDNATVAILNLTAAAPHAPGHLTVHACNTPRPNTSNVNYTPGITQANLVVAPLDDNGRTCIYTHATTHIIADLQGYLTKPVPPPSDDFVAAGTPQGDTSSSTLAGTRVGSRNYKVPAGAVVVSPNGSDRGAGTTSSPYRTVSQAISSANSGATIVLRGGLYHETITVPSNKRLTIQAWPNEEVWFDGSVQVVGWARDGSHWRYDGWTHEFDSSPTMTRGAPDNTADYWRFINPDYPMAAHPDQIWIDGVAQRQVASRSEVTAGAFYHDEPNDRLYIGTDPTNRSVRASALQRALVIKGENSVVRGIGVRRYAPSMPDLGAVVIDGANGVTIEHVAITDVATRGLSIHAENVTVRNTVAARNGNMGIGGSRAHGLVLDRVVAADNNLERFNTSPVAGGAKFGRLKGIHVRDSVFRDNYGTGLWLDETTVDIVIVGNEMHNNFRHGTSLELSSRATFANNIVTGNGAWGLKINNTDSTQVWNNTFSGNHGGIWLVQDDRSPDPNGDNRQPFPDLNITWLIGPATFANNVLASGPGSREPFLSVVDTTGRRSAEQIGVTADSNVYNRPDGEPNRIVRWSEGDTAASYSDVAAFRSGTGQEANGHDVSGAIVASATGASTGSMPDHSTARPLPASVAAAAGIESGSRRLGAWPR